MMPTASPRHAVVLDVEVLEIDPTNPRVHVEPDDVAALVPSIRARGIDDPLKVRPLGDGRYGVLSGQQRLAAARTVGLETVPCIVLEDLDDRDAWIVAITANVGTAPMRPSDEARAYAALVEQGMTQYAIAEAVGVTQAHVSTWLKILELPAEVVADVDAGKIGVHRAVNRARRRYENGLGKARGRARTRAVEFGAIGAAHLTTDATAKLLGVTPDTVRRLAERGALERDADTGGFALNTIADHLGRVRAAAEARAAADGAPSVPAELLEDVRTLASTRNETVEHLVARAIAREVAHPGCLAARCLAPAMPGGTMFCDRHMGRLAQLVRDNRRRESRADATRRAARALITGARR